MRFLIDFTFKLAKVLLESMKEKKHVMVMLMMMAMTDDGIHISY